VRGKTTLYPSLMKMGRLNVLAVMVMIFGKRLWRDISDPCAIAIARREIVGLANALLLLHVRYLSQYEAFDGCCRTRGSILIALGFRLPKTACSQGALTWDLVATRTVHGLMITPHSEPSHERCGAEASRRLDASLDGR